MSAICKELFPICLDQSYAIKKKNVLRVRRNSCLMMHVGTLHHFVQHLQDEDENFLLHDNNDIFNLSEHYVSLNFYSVKTIFAGSMENGNGL